MKNLGYGSSNDISSKIKELALEGLALRGKAPVGAP
jgi:hypothetical protein